MNCRHMRNLYFAAAACGAVLLLIAMGCGKKPATKEAAGAAPGQPPSVGVAEVTQKTVPIYSEFVGQTAASQTVEVRARAQGVLEKILFTEGSVVRKGQVLFQIQKNEYQARVLAAKAALAK